MEPLRQFCETYGAAAEAEGEAGDGQVLGLPVQLSGADALAAAAGGFDVKSEPGLGGGAAALGGRPSLEARSQSAVAGAEAFSAMMPGRQPDVVTHRLGTGGAPAPGLSGEELLDQFKKVLKGALSWRPETAELILKTTGWRKRSDGQVVAAADWHSVCPSDLRTLGQQLEQFSWFRGHSDDDYVTATLRENAIFRLYAAMRKFKEHRKQPWEPQPVMLKARQHEQKEYERVQNQREAKDGEEMLKDKKLQLYVYLLKKSCTIMDNATTTGPSKPPEPQGNDDSGGGLAHLSSGRCAADSETFKYWELLDRMRPYKTFALKYINGPLHKWREESKLGLRTEPDPLLRERYAKHIAIANAIAKMFFKMQQLCEDTPQDFKNVPNLRALVKIKSTLDTVIQRCRQQPAQWPRDLPEPGPPAPAPAPAPVALVAPVAPVAPVASVAPVAPVAPVGAPPAGQGHPPHPSKPPPKPTPDKDKQEKQEQPKKEKPKKQEKPKKPKKPAKNARDPAIMAVQPKLPYDLTELTWNRDNFFTKKGSRNDQKRYCYCGEHKPDQPAIMCNVCNQWFHTGCCDPNVVPHDDEDRFLPFQLNYEFTCKCCNYTGELETSWKESFRLVKASWVQSVLSAQASLMHRYQRYCFKVSEVKVFLEQNWNLLCLDENKDDKSGPAVPKDKRGGAWTGPLNSYWTTHEKKYFTKPLRNYWGLQAHGGATVGQPAEVEDFGPCLTPQHLFRSHIRREPPIEDKRQQSKPKPKTKIKITKEDIEVFDKFDKNPFAKAAVEEDAEALCQVCNLGKRKLGHTIRNSQYCRKCEQEKCRLTPIPRAGEDGYEGCVVAEYLWHDGTIENIWLCGRCERQVRLKKSFTFQPYGFSPKTIKYEKFIHKPPPDDPEEAWVGCTYCTDDSQAWHHERCVGFDQQIGGDADWCCKKPGCRRKHVAKLMANPENQDISTPTSAPSPASAVDVDETLALLERTYRSTDLPLTPISEYIEGYLKDQVPDEAVGVTVRVVSNTQETTKMSKRLVARYGRDPTVKFMQKQIYAFQESGPGEPEVCFFGLQVQEYGDDQPAPHDNVAYLAYLDSCQLYHVPGCCAHEDKVGKDTWLEPDAKKQNPCTKPMECREAGRKLYRALMHAYMQTLRLRGFRELWIWVMAPNASDPNDPNADYMFNYRPAYQFIPDQRRLESWYTKLLQSAREVGILQDVADNTGLAPTDKGKSEKDVRNINFALNTEHVRDTVPTPTSGGSKRKLSDLSPPGDADAMDLEDALPPADPDAVEEQEASTRKSKRSKGSPAAAAAQKQAAAMAAAEAAGRSTRSAAAAEEDCTLSVKNMPLFKDDHLASMVDVVLEEEETKRKETARPGIGLKRTKSSTVAKKVADKLRDRSQGSYMVCHFVPRKETETPLLDDPPHRIDGVDVNDRKKLLEVMYQHRYQFNTLRQARHATMMMLFYFLGHRTLRSVTERVSRAAMMNERVQQSAQQSGYNGTEAMVDQIARR